MARRRRIPRYKKTAILIAGSGVALGLAAVVLWPQLKKLFQNPSITVGLPTITPSGSEIGALQYESIIRRGR